MIYNTLEGAFKDYVEPDYIKAFIVRVPGQHCTASLQISEIEENREGVMEEYAFRLLLYNFRDGCGYGDGQVIKLHEELVDHVKSVLDSKKRIPSIGKPRVRSILTREPFNEELSSLTEVNYWTLRSERRGPERHKIIPASLLISAAKYILKENNFFVLEPDIIMEEYAFMCEDAETIRKQITELIKQSDQDFALLESLNNQLERAERRKNYRKVQEIIVEMERFKQTLRNQARKVDLERGIDLEGQHF